MTEYRISDPRPGTRPIRKPTATTEAEHLGRFLDKARLR